MMGSSNAAWLSRAPRKRSSRGAFQLMVLVRRDLVDLELVLDDFGCGYGGCSGLWAHRCCDRDGKEVLSILLKLTLFGFQKQYFAYIF
jgi:hypothetical protein